MVGRKIRVLLAKPGLDGHDQGVKVVALGLRDAGMEVIYTGLRQTPEQIVHVALQEDVDVVGISSLSGGHNVYIPKIIELLKKENKEILIIAGGIIPDDDRERLKALGVKGIFGPGTKLREIVDFIIQNVSGNEM